MAAYSQKGSFKKADHNFIHELLPFFLLLIIDSILVFDMTVYLTFKTAQVAFVQTLRKLTTI